MHLYACSAYVYTATSSCVMSLRVCCIRVLRIAYMSCGMCVCTCSRLFMLVCCVLARFVLQHVYMCMMYALSLKTLCIECIEPTLNVLCGMCIRVLRMFVYTCICEVYIRVYVYMSIGYLCIHVYCVYVYICISRMWHVYTCIAYVCKHVYMCICVHVYVCICVSCLFVCMCIVYMCICVCKSYVAGVYVYRVCLHACVYVYVCITYACVRVFCVPACMCISLMWHVYMCIAYVCIHVSMWHVYTCICVYVYTCICVYVYRIYLYACILCTGKFGAVACVYVKGAYDYTSRVYSCMRVRCTVRVHV